MRVAPSAFEVATRAGSWSLNEAYVAVTHDDRLVRAHKFWPLLETFSADGAPEAESWLTFLTWPDQQRANRYRRNRRLLDAHVLDTDEHAELNRPVMWTATSAAKVGVTVLLFNGNLIQGYSDASEPLRVFSLQGIGGFASSASVSAEADRVCAASMIASVVACYAIPAWSD
jgi:hypothetical protein